MTLYVPPLDGRTTASNTAVGQLAGVTISSGTGNTFAGSSAGTNVGTGSGNTFVGATAGAALSSGTNNVAIGLLSMRFASTAFDNVCAGYQSGNSEHRIGQRVPWEECGTIADDWNIVRFRWQRCWAIGDGFWVRRDWSGRAFGMHRER
jgi:hypothetical protein